MARLRAALCVGFAACAPDLPDADEAARVERAYTGPMPLAFGDCAAPSVAFVSGPRPQPFTADDADLSAAPGDPAAATRSPPPPRRSHDPIDARTPAIARSRAGIVTGPGDDELLIGVRPGTRTSGWYTARYRPRIALPMVTLGAISVVGGLDKAIVRRYVRRYTDHFEYCYASELVSRPWLAGGTLRLSFTIAADGEVSEAIASGIDRTVDDCVARVARGIKFPAARRGVEARVAYVLDVKPPPGSPTKPPPWVKPPRPARSRQLFRDDGMFGFAPSYVPGAHSLIAPRAEQLAACFRADPRRRGAAVIGLVFDSAGVLATSVVEGVPAPVAACIGEALAGLAPERSPGSVRCPVAYGETPLDEARGIDLRRSVALDGIAFGTAATLDGQSIPALVGTLEAQRARVLAPDGPAIAVHHPIVVRPADETPMRAVYSAVASIVAAGEDSVLAVHRDGAWRALRAIAYPIAPVPYNTGGRWSPIPVAQRPGPSHVSDSDSGVQLSVYLDDAHVVWLGVSRLAELHKLEAEPAQLEKLLAALVEQKARALFADRTDLEIAAAANVPYGEVAALIDVATRAGFVEWQLLEERALSARPTR